MRLRWRDETVRRRRYGDMLSGALATSATPQSNVGGYAITQGSLAASPNYTLGYIGAKLEIAAARPINVASLSSSLVRDNINPMWPTDGASLVFEAASLTNPPGIGTFYADPRFAHIFVCLVAGGQTARPCVDIEP